MSFEYFIAKRYIRGKKRTGFISIITIASIIGVTIGVTALILVLSIMDGFKEAIQSKVIGADAHIRLRKFFEDTISEKDTIFNALKKNPQIVASSQAIFKKCMIKSRSTQCPTFVKGIDLNTAKNVSDLPDRMIKGTLDFSPKVINGKEYPGIVLGSFLAKELSATEIGDIVILYSLSKEQGLLPQAQVIKFYVAGIVEYGYYEYDRIFSYITLKSAQQLFNMPESYTWIEIKIKDYQLAGTVAEEIENALGYPYTCLTWFDLNKTFFNWLQLQKKWTFVVLTLIIMVAAFNIVSSLIMIVIEKTREIGILKSMGASISSIMKIFMIEGIIIGIVGTVAGNLLGYLISYLQLEYKIISIASEVYYINYLPIKIQYSYFITVSLIAIFLCFTASIYPAFKASRLYPVDAIRYE
jgi:lipoprotein-releasing system permease protein